MEKESLEEVVKTLIRVHIPGRGDQLIKEIMSYEGRTDPRAYFIIATKYISLSLLTAYTIKALYDLYKAIF